MAINSYWRPGDWEWSLGKPFKGTPLHDTMANSGGQNARSGYYANWLGGQGYLGDDITSDFARSLLNKFEQGYSAAQFEDPDIKWTDYLDQYQGKVGDIISATDPLSRGVDRRRYSGNARWLQRGW